MELYMYGQHLLSVSTKKKKGNFCNWSVRIPFALYFIGSNQKQKLRGI